MLFRQLFDAESSTYTYLLAGRAGGEALLIDPVQGQTALYLQLLRELERHVAPGGLVAARAGRELARIGAAERVYEEQLTSMCLAEAGGSAA